MTYNSSKDERWREQYQRICRWYEKTRKVDYYEEFKNKEYHNDQEALSDLFLHQNSITDEGLDVYYAFFLNCFHLRDWLIHSNALEKGVIDEFFHKNQEMKLCHIICTGSKHLEITDPKILDTKKDKFGHRVEYDPSRPNGDKDGSVKTRLIYLNGIIYDLMDLSKECMYALNSFLLKNSLLELNKRKNI